MQNRIKSGVKLDTKLTNIVNQTVEEDSVIVKSTRTIKKMKNGKVVSDHVEDLLNSN